MTLQVRKIFIFVLTPFTAYDTVDDNLVEFTQSPVPKFV